MIPEFLKPYEVSLQAYQREVVKITAKPLNTSALQDSLTVRTSKFLGLPFFPKSKEYPIDKNGEPMLLAAQLNFSEIPQLTNFPVDGILQLFLSGTNWYNDESKVVYHTKAETSEEHMDDFSFISQDDYGEMPILCVHSLQFEKSTENGGLGDVQFDFQFGDADWLDFTEKLGTKEEKEFQDYFAADGHKLGGYAEFTQDDPRDGRIGNQNDVQLLQIDTDERIIIGDVGICHVFIDPESLQAGNLEKAYFTWDCC